MNKLLKNIKPDMISGGLILSFSLFIILQSIELRADARLIPLITALLIMVFSVTIIIGSFKSKNSESFSVAILKKNMDKPLLFIILLTLLYVFILPIIGFEITSFCYLIIVMAIIERELFWSRVLISGIVTLTLVFIFSFGLNLRIPLLFSKFFNI
ncbi:MAG: tripartite tricarboxylate transporter TctB family protein [Melioribacteraceae bacterium]|nr:tripartite tricarboxylate transporter TctB family protein [Melioribacteraceae bacterium]